MLQEKLKTILPPEMVGVMKISGYRGIGKSYLASQADRPDNIIFLDFESKAEGIHQQLQFGKYISMSALAAQKYGAEYKPLEMYEVFKKTISEVEQDRYTVLIIDNLQPFEEAAYAFVKKYPIQFGIEAQRAQTGAFGGCWPAVHGLISGYCNRLHARGIKLIIVTSHLKAVWGSQGPIPNKFKAKGLERWDELSILTLNLIPGETPPIPAALVAKEQLGGLSYDEEKGEHTIVRRLPLRIPVATFANIRKYLREPANLQHPAQGETPSDEESAPFSDKLSKDQLGYLKALAEAQAAGEVTHPEDDLSDDPSAPKKVEGKK